ncbi:MAG: hypothetical protein ABJC19_03035 [Gemmatimonadota bacterium]
MTTPRRSPPEAAPPWLFTLMCLTGLGGAVILWLVISTGLARRSDADRHLALRRELVRLDQAQSAAYARTGRYATSLDGSDSGEGLGFVPTADLQLQFRSFSGEAWQAVARDTMLATAPNSCGVYRGPPSASPHRAVVAEGSVECW